MVQAVEEAIQHAQEATPGVLLQEQLHVQCLLYDDSRVHHPQPVSQYCYVGMFQPSRLHPLRLSSS
jgi:hypothetical protein